MWGITIDDNVYEITDRVWLDNNRNYIDYPPKDNEPMIDRILRRVKAVCHMIKTIYKGDPIPRATGFYKSGENKSKRWMFCWDGQRII